MEARGGKRKGAGRKAIYTDPVRFSIIAEREMLDRLDEWAQAHDLPRAEAIKLALQEIVKRKRTPKSNSASR